MHDRNYPHLEPLPFPDRKPPWWDGEVLFWVIASLVIFVPIVLFFLLLRGCSG